MCTSAININDAKAIERTAKLIVAYLCSRKQASDTIDGIANWWIMRQRLHEEKRHVEQAVEFLFDQGLIEKRTLSDGSVLYTANCNSNKQAPGKDH